ncbi:MAG: NAD-dependent epimerase/dehydratase family protein [Crocinitomicaceae bacterium]|nr:NAD-dependent epimerase/dehydratase family protein [Crocinitomicaceae bacterium]
MILITGATGLVGSHLALQLLENGEKIRAIYRNETSILATKSLFELYEKSHLFNKIEWIQADITDIPSLEIAFANVVSVFHCAALISFDPKDEALLRKTNIEGTANIVNFSIAKGIKKLCYVSSIAALGDLKEHETIITEETEWNPEKHHSDYAISKYGAEMEIWRGQQEGLKVVVINPGIILGPGFWKQGSGKLFTAVANGLKFYTKGTSGFVSVNDVVNLLIMGMSKIDEKENGQRFIAIENNYSYETILNEIAVALKVGKPKFYAAYWQTELAWRWNWLTSILLNKKRMISKETMRSSHQLDCYSNEKVRIKFNYQFKNVPLYIKEIGRYYFK